MDWTTSDEVITTISDGGNDTIEMILSNGSQIYTINYTLSNTNKVNITDIEIEDTTIVNAYQNKIEKGSIKISVKPKNIGETYITLTNKFKPEVTKRIKVIVK